METWHSRLHWQYHGYFHIIIASGHISQLLIINQQFGIFFLRLKSDTMLFVLYQSLILEPVHVKYPSVYTPLVYMVHY